MSQFTRSCLQDIPTLLQVRVSDSVAFAPTLQRLESHRTPASFLEMNTLPHEASHRE